MPEYLYICVWVESSTTFNNAGVSCFMANTQHLHALLLFATTNPHVFKIVQQIECLVFFILNEYDMAFLVWLGVF